jgi:outer membrane protein insertion porin family
LQGGVSGLAGSFIGLTYQTNNFLGLGETLTFSAQFGDLQRSFQFGFTEPYLFDRPISSGFTLFTSRYNFDQARQEALLTGQSVSINPQFVQNYNQNSTGFTLFASYPPKKYPFARFGLTYGLTRTNIQSFNQASTLLFESVQFRSIVGPSALNGIVSSTVTPTFTYNTINNPVNPTGGKSFFYSLSFSGGPLGGNVKTISNAFEFKMFRPVNKKRNVIGFRVTTAYTTGYGGGEVPPFSRFYAGGENDIRGFDIRSISPVTFIPTETAQPVFYRDLSGITRSFTVPVLIYTATLPGGDYQGYGYFEYRIPIVGPVTAGFFFDGGTVGVVRRNALQLDTTGFDNLTQGPFAHFPHAQAQDGLTQQLSISPGTNFRLRGSAGIEFVVQLPIVQAPFRIYYAYNIHRFHSEIFAKNPFVDPDEIKSIKNSFDPATANLILEQLQFQPSGLNYFEPKTTFRFTVSRTF